MKTRTVGIVSLESYPAIGGIARYVMELGGYLQRSSIYHPIIISPFSIPNTDIEHVACCPRSVHASFFRSNIFYRSFFRLLPDLVKRSRIDFLHFMNPFSNFFQRPVIQIPIVMTIQNTASQFFSSPERHDSKTTVRTLLSYYALQRAERMSFPYVSKFICVSESAKRALIETYQIDRNKIVVIPNGVNASIFYPSLKYKKIPQSILYVGRLHPRKGIQFLLRAVSILKKEMPNFKLYIVGEGPLRPELEQYTKNHGIDSNVFFLGFLSSDALHKWYNKCSIMVNPAMYEGLPIATMEGMACGLPVIGVHTDGIDELIRERENGFLVDYNDDTQLVHKISVLLSREDLRYRFGSMNIKIISSRFSSDYVGGSITKIYDSFF